MFSVCLSTGVGGVPVVQNFATRCPHWSAWGGGPCSSEFCHQVSHWSAWGGGAQKKICVKFFKKIFFSFSKFFFFNFFSLQFFFSKFFFSNFFPQFFGHDHQARAVRLFRSRRRTVLFVIELWVCFCDFSVLRKIADLFRVRYFIYSWRGSAKD